MRRARGSQRALRKKRLGERDCSACPRYASSLLGTGTVHICVLGAWHDVRPMIRTGKRLIYNKENRDLVIHIL